jgi:hypothetical protein
MADLDGDGLQDVVQWDQSSGALSIAKNDGALTFTTKFTVSVPTDWALVGVADLNGDGHHELGAAPWEIAGSPYFDGTTGLPEILWYNAQTGAVGVWRVSGTSISWSVIAIPGTQWAVQPTVNGD